jgi:DNA-binding CsgD family transcriptional regulator
MALGAMVRPLTSRETEILDLSAKGKSVRDIVDAFDISERAARAHLQMIAEKLGVTDCTQAVAAALREGKITL